MKPDMLSRNSVAEPTRDRTAPAGRAPVRRQSWLFILLATVAGSLQAATAGEAIHLPSGETALLQEVIEETSGEDRVARFRFIAPWVAGTVDYAVVAVDMESLCQTYALSRMADLESPPTRIIVSLAQNETEFAVANPEITQFFESYTLSEGLCIWEPF